MDGASKDYMAGEDGFALQLLSRIARREREAMEQFYGLYQEAVYRLALVRLDSPPAAAQQLHELMLRVWVGAATCPPGERPRTWLLGQLVACTEVPEPEVDGFEAQPDPSTAAVAVARDPASASENLHSVLRRLPERYRTILHLAYFEHLADAEIARMLDRPEGAVAWSRRQGRDALASMQQLGGASDDRGRDLFLDSWVRRELRTAPDPAPGDFGLDRLRVALRQVDREQRRGGWSGLLRRVGDGLGALRAAVG